MTSLALINMAKRYSKQNGLFLADDELVLPGRPPQPWYAGVLTQWRGMSRRRCCCDESSSSESSESPSSSSESSSSVPKITCGTCDFSSEVTIQIPSLGVLDSSGGSCNLCDLDVQEKSYSVPWLGVDGSECVWRWNAHDPANPDVRVALPRGGYLDWIGFGLASDLSYAWSSVSIFDIAGSGCEGWVFDALYFYVEFDAGTQCDDLTPSIELPCVSTEPASKCKWFIGGSWTTLAPPTENTATVWL